MQKRKKSSSATEFFRGIARTLLTRPVTWTANRISSAPKQENVNAALSELYRSITREPGKMGPLVNFHPDENPIIIFSDMHKGTRDGSDDFANCEENFLAALDHYNKRKFYYLNLGDSEELWENILPAVIKSNKACFEAEGKFLERNAFIKLFGNHDLYWGYDLLASAVLKSIYKMPLKAHAGAVLRANLPNGNLDIFCTHGHQGDSQSDGNAFSKWFVSYIWGPLQSFLEINTNTPSCNEENKTLHNQFMYEWSAVQENLVLVTGHTHQPVFNSLTHLESLYLQLEAARSKNDEAAINTILAEIPRRRREYDYVNQSYQSMKPSYFNAGCCCYADGDITGIEIAEGYMRLVKWGKKEGVPTRIVADEIHLVELAGKITG
ncbi:metallophosphoesterase [Flavihumibacter profundi]|uniref:metallophosphoesterase n=1 Tax=Flavihumibacter profundi TaxID=2716883 RepID=UPI001CC6984D|nr:metallophosphoesterase [Flavihumibacter profundi]MBZ5857966.1 metallophosphoesterase [Flavihumibacter profundi]